MIENCNQIYFLRARDDYGNFFSEWKTASKDLRHCQPRARYWRVLHPSTLRHIILKNKAGLPLVPRDVSTWWNAQRLELVLMERCVRYFYLTEWYHTGWGGQ